MRIHSDFLARGDFNRALDAAGLYDGGVYIGAISMHASRKRQRAYEVRLAADSGKDADGKRRRPSAGLPGLTAATYDEWGYWLAELFRLDPAMHGGNDYQGAAQFHERTRNAYA